MRLSFKVQFFLCFFGGGGHKKGYRVHTWPKKPIMALIYEYLSPDLSPHAFADMLGMIKYMIVFKGQLSTQERHNENKNRFFSVNLQFSNLVFCPLFA